MAVLPWAGNISLISNVVCKVLLSMYSKGHTKKEMDYIISSATQEGKKKFVDKVFKSSKRSRR